MRRSWATTDTIPIHMVVEIVRVVCCPGLVILEVLCFMLMEPFATFYTFYLYHQAKKDMHF